MATMIPRTSIGTHDTASYHIMAIQPSFRHMLKALLKEYKEDLSPMHYGEIAQRVSTCMRTTLFVEDIRVAFEFFSSCGILPRSCGAATVPGNLDLDYQQPQYMRNTMTATAAEHWIDGFLFDGPSSTEPGPSQGSAGLFGSGHESIVHESIEHDFTQLPDTITSIAPNSNDQQYPCELCPKSFSTQKLWTDHRNRSCFPIERFECQRCTYRASRRDNARSHLSKSHKIKDRKEANKEIKQRMRNLPEHFHQYCGYCATDTYSGITSSAEPFLNRAASDHHIFKHLEEHLAMYQRAPVRRERCNQIHRPGLPEN